MAVHCTFNNNINSALCRNAVFVSYARLERPHLLHSNHEGFPFVFLFHEAHALAEHQANRASIAMVSCTLEMQ